MRYSVITINYNNREGLRNTIKSVVCQKFNDFEFIIIDGGSTDGSVDVIQEYSSDVSFWVSEKDRGIYHAMNKGVAQAHGDYCIFMNSGDCFYDNRVLESMEIHSFKEELLVGKIVSKTNKFLFDSPKRPLSLYYLYSGTVPHQSTFIKTDMLRQYPYDENLGIVSDWKFFVQLIVLHSCSIRFVDQIIARFDTNGVSTSNPEEMWREKEQVLSELFPSRVLADYQYMKSSECLTQALTPQLRQHYLIDKILYCIGRFFLNIIS